MKLAPLFAIACLAVACSSGSSGSVSSGPGSSGTGSFTGTIGGKAFTFRSAYASVHSGKVDLIFSDFDGLCESIGRSRIHAGESLVQAYGLQGTAPGKFTGGPDGFDVKYATVASTCTAGQRVEQSVDKHSDASASDADITLSSLTATNVEGDVTLTFKDGSSISGHFFVPTCASENDLEHATCY
jgi:hypothetical protein